MQYADGSTGTYEYDDAYRLTREVREDADGMLYEQTFQYGAVGNRTRMTAKNLTAYKAGTETLGLWHFDREVEDAVEREVNTVRVYINGEVDASTMPFGVPVVDNTVDVLFGGGFDGMLDEIRLSAAAMGSRLNRSEEAYVYNARNQLATSTGGGTLTTYSYDANGNQIGTVTTRRNGLVMQKRRL